MGINLSELKHTLKSDLDKSTRNILSELGRSQKGTHTQLKQLDLFRKIAQWVSKAIRVIFFW